MRSVNHELTEASGTGGGGVSETDEILSAAAKVLEEHGYVAFKPNAILNARPDQMANYRAPSVIDLDVDTALAELEGKP